MGLVEAVEGVVPIKTLEAKGELAELEVATGRTAVQPEEGMGELEEVVPEVG
jgi:hypothetical protein